MEKILFLDFDGVLFDTIKEVYLVNRYIQTGINLFEPVEEKSYALFSKYKYLVYNIWMFYYYNLLLFSNTKEEDIVAQYKKLISNRGIKKEEEFCKNFLQIRADLIKNHYDFWQKLETPYQFFYDIKEFYNEEKINIVVASKKNKSSILKRFSEYNFNLDENKVFARDELDKFSSKGEFFENYMKENNYQKALFVDDNINNINSCKNYKNIDTILALWGNCEPNNKGFSEKEAIEKIQNFFKN